MIKIKNMDCGIVGIATHLEVKILSFSTTDKSCSIYYQLMQVDAKKTTDSVLESDDVIIQTKRICEGNMNITEKEFEEWGSDNEYIENLVMKNLNLERE